MLQTDSFLTPKQAADALGVSERQVQNWCKEGQLPARRVGRAYRIPTEAIAKLPVKAAEPTIDIGETFEVELASLVEAWLWEMEHGPKPRSKETIRTHRMHLVKYVRTLLGPDAPPDARLGYAEAISEQALLRVLGRIPIAQFATRYNVFMAVMSLCNFLMRQHLLAPEVKLAMKQHKPKRLLPPKRTALKGRAELNRFIGTIWLSETLSVYEKTLNTAIVGTMAYAGLRVSEVAHLELRDLDLEGRLLHVRVAKGGKERVVGINKRLSELLTAYLAVRPGADSRRLFLGNGGVPLTRDYIVKRIARISKRSGIKISAHGLRRTFATLAANAGHSVNLIQLALGHADLSTTQQYLMADQRTAAAAMQRW